MSRTAEEWEAIKAQEKKEKGALSGVPVALPGLLRAVRVGEKASAVSYDWPDIGGPRQKIDEELAELIGREFHITQAAVSQHLKVLRENGFATVRVDGPRRIYAVDADPLQDIDAWLNRFRHFWEPKLDALATEVARGKRKRR